jgi:phosphopantetheinyl transferase
MRLISDPEDWNGELPPVLVAPASGTAERRALLRALVAYVLGAAPDVVSIAHEEGRAPRLLVPEDAAFHLSSASRDGLAALAVGRAPVGVDIELVEAATEPPWHVLHPEERAWLMGLPAGERERGFARLWAAKEAYLKALGIGVAREPSSFAVLPEGEAMQVRDPARPGERILVATASTTDGGRDFAVALVERVATS